MAYDKQALIDQLGQLTVLELGGQVPAQPEPATYERGQASLANQTHRHAGPAEHPTPTSAQGSQARQLSEPPVGAPWQNERPPPTPPKRAELPSRPAPKAPAPEAAPGDRPKMGKLRRILSALDSHQAIDLLIKQLKKTRSNGEFLMQVASSAPMAADKDEEDYV